MLLAILIGSNRRRRRTTRSGWRENWFALGSNRDKAIHIFCIRQDRINGRCRKILLLGGNLYKEAVIAWMNGTQEEHDLENLWNRDRGKGEDRQISLEARTKLVNPLGIALFVVE
jgi:hypothetical protein